METMTALARLLLALGAVLILVGGGLLLFVFWVGRIPWLGRLPGDLLIQRKHVTVYVPLTTSLILSLLGTLILWFLSRR